MLAGPVTREDVIKSVDKGIYVQDVSNGQVKIGEGDFAFYVSQGRMIDGLSQRAPLVRGNGASNDGLCLLDHHSDLGNRILRIGRDGEAVFLEHHELMAGAAIGAVEAKLPEPTDEVSSLTQCPPAHAWAPC